MTPAHLADAPLRGIAFALLGVTVFPFQDVIVKWLSGDYPVMQIMLVRSAVGLPFNLLLVLWLDGSLGAVRPRRAGLMLGRALLIVMAFTAYYMAIATLALAELAALFFAAPLIMTALSALLLREPVGVNRWAAVALGFLGVLVTLRPGTGVFEPAALLGLVAALAYACAQLVTRRLGRSDSGACIAFHTTLVYGVVAGVDGLVLGAGVADGGAHPSLAFLLRPWVMPQPGDALLMALCAPIATVGIFSLVQAYRLAPAPVVAPFEYLMLAWAAINGYLFWGDLPDGWTWTGMSLVAGAGLYVVWRETRLARGRARAGAR